MRDNPCLTCGACCASFRVSFYWAEADPRNPDGVPEELTEALPPLLRCMRGTNRNPPRCVALEGEIGRSVRCTIHARRPTPCREFGVQWTEGRPVASAEELARCNRARARWNLPPLDPADFSLPAQPTTQTDPRARQRGNPAGR